MIVRSLQNSSAHASVFMWVLVPEGLSPCHQPFRGCPSSWSFQPEFLTVVSDSSQY